MSLQAEIEFLAPAAQPLFAYGRGTAPPGAQPATARFVPRQVEIGDVRDGQALRLDTHGATLGRWPTRVRRFDEEAHIRARYYPECASLIQSLLGADRVIVFDHNVRVGGAAALASGFERPVHHAHTDYTPVSALQRLRQEVGDGAQLTVARYLQVNLWRPIRAPLRDAPLALCDGASVSPRALRRVELRYPERTGEIYYLVHEPGQRWYFASDMDVDEAWLFKNFDSSRSGPCRTAPHSAFIDPRHPNVAPRESIEVRALVLYG